MTPPPADKVGWISCYLNQILNPPSGRLTRQSPSSSCFDMLCSEILFCICHCLSISSKMKRLLLASSLTQGATTTSLVVSSLIWFYTGCLSWHNLKQHLSSNQTSIFFSSQANVTTATKASLASLLWPLTSKVYFYPKNRLEDILYYLDCD